RARWPAGRRCLLGAGAPPLAVAHQRDAQGLLVLVQGLVLPQHAQPRRLRDRGHALVGLDVAAQDAQQRRLARPVRAHQTVALARVELERRAREEDLAAVTLGDVGYR